MKKGLIFLFGIVSFFGINTVSADTTITISDWYDRFDEYIDDYNTYKENIDYLISYWEENLSSDYPYYAVVEMVNGFWTDSTTPGFYLTCSKRNFVYKQQFTLSFLTSSLEQGTGIITSITYDSTKDEYIIPDSERDSLYDLTGNVTYSWEYQVLVSNGLIYNSEDKYLIPSYTSETLGISIPEIELTQGSVYPSLIDLYDGSYISNLTNTYKEINLNDYAYVALSLKNYDDIPENNYSTYTNIYVKGQLCSTPVYNYGQTERKDVLTGTQVQACTSYYNDFTLLRKYILKTDVENHAIYYFKGYDSTKENIVKVDTSIYNITYITEEDKDNPQVNINGKIYPTLSYDSLTDTATKSEDEGYVSGVVCAVGDLNCHQEYSKDNMFTDLFDKPLEILKSVWGAIISIFNLIGQFIALLPPTMQSFLYLAFGISIILGIIKILL